MSWSYTGIPGDSLKDEVRFITGDTDENFPLMQDEEILYALTQSEQDVLGASILMCRAIVAKFSKEVDYAIGPEKVSAGERHKYYASLLNQLVRKSAAATAIPLAELRPSSFSVGMHDNK